MFFKSLHTHCGLLAERFHLSLQFSSVTVHDACVNHQHQPITRMQTHTHAVMLTNFTFIHIIPTHCLYMPVCLSMYRKVGVPLFV